MPFKLKLPKKKQYNVLSKSAFVTSVELLDSTQIECTLSTSSLGRECLTNACQRLSLVHLQYLGLQFHSRYGGSLWWVDLDAPLKKQLDKLTEHPGLYLRVMYSTMDDEGLQDEATRYHFFLQLKMDIIEGRLPCTPDQAVTLAAYALQAEFGNHDQERHTSEYLNNFVLLPSCLPPEMKETLWEKLIQKHRSLQSLSQSQAEISYIKEAQMLEGYGQECFPAKDGLGNQVTLKIFANGVYVDYGSRAQKPTICLIWPSISNLSQHKKHLVIHCKETKQLDFVLEDATYAKYVFRIATQHFSLFKDRNVQTIALTPPAQANGSQAHLPMLNNHAAAPPSQKMDHPSQEFDVRTYSATSVAAAAPTSRENLAQPSPPAYRPAPEYNVAVQHMQPKPTTEQDVVLDGTTIDPRIQYLESKVKDGQVFQEFEMIVRTKALADFTTSLMPENILRNRFKDVLPYEENRVKLSPTKENPYGYINASHIRISRLSYIAAQGPLSTTVTDFWQMVWEYDVNLIVMLTGLQEQGQEKCFPYWPGENQTELRFGPYTIKRISHLISGPFSTSHLMLFHRDQQKPLWHFQYHEWPDHCCPDDVTGFLSFMQEVDSVRRITTATSSHGQMLVHCSAGVGRSGVVILCDIMFYALNHNEPIDIPGVLTQLRMQRMFTVQTLAQYQFIYVVLIEYLKKCRLI